ncbi:MAG: hypothetical protein H7Y17_16215 [Chlorobia bacterium]|nr:hypothetical protein [Fimbriimonadaceae bacterium]
MLRQEVEGNTVELKPNPSKPGSPLEFEHRTPAGAFVKWTQTIDKCDKPSLAGGVTPCGTASRVGRAVKGNVEWLVLARKTKDKPDILTAEPMWQLSNPEYELAGYIGFNRVTGELAFFDGAYNIGKFRYDQPIIAPGGRGYADTSGRVKANTMYDNEFTIPCSACHDNKEPRIITPYIKQARVGYRDSALQAANSLKALLPPLTRGARSPYRIIGSSYSAAHKGITLGGLSITDPTDNCTTCHGLTNNGTAKFASDAVGYLGGLEDTFRTDWSLRTGLGKTHPWMLPGVGNDLTANPPSPMLSPTDWALLRAELENPTPATSYRLYTEAPAPESTTNDQTRLADPSGPTGLSLVVGDNRDGTSEPMNKEGTVSWFYQNTLGGIPERDDVRFDVLVRSVPIPSSGTPPNPSDYPPIAEAQDTSAILIAGSVFKINDDFLVKDLSYWSHQRATEATPTTSPRSYRLSFPAKSGTRVLVRIVAKRFAFDQSGEKYSSVDHLAHVDVP